MEKFPHIQLKGTPDEIGRSHGRLLKAHLGKAIEFYTDTTETLDKMDRVANVEKILTMAKHFKVEIDNFSENYKVEIEAIAETTNVDPLWIYALNSRTEIITTLKVAEENECTAIYFSNSKLLGQNWDWASMAEDFAVTMTIEREDGHKILQMTEPGIIGKIGLNNKGIGVCLNFLTLGEEIKGLPVHIVLRSFLDSSSIEDALQRLEPVKYGKSSNIIIADDQGKWEDIEFAGRDVFFLEKGKATVMHTNHFLADKDLNKNAEDLSSSYARFKQASTMLQGVNGPIEQSMDVMKGILLDRSNAELPICRPYAKGTTMKDTGTVCTIVMDLNKQLMEITKGNPLTNKFESISLI